MTFKMRYHIENKIISNRKFKVFYMDGYHFLLEVDVEECQKERAKLGLFTCYMCRIGVLKHIS